MLINLYINLCKIVNDSVEKRMGKIKQNKYCKIHVNESVDKKDIHKSELEKHEVRVQKNKLIG